MSKIDVSYGVLHYNPSANPQAHIAFARAMRSLAENAKLPHEVFVIDQGNVRYEADEVCNLCQDYGFNFISLKNNIGISRGINFIANIARGKYVSLVTSDVEFTPGLDESLVNTLEANKDIWQICPVSDKSDIIYQRQDYQTDGIIRTFAQELTIQFWPRFVFDEVGYFDERWKACYENLDYAVRIFMAGGFAAISHDAFCPHDFHMSMRSGARDHSYDGYIDGGFDQSLLANMWHEKWPQLNKYIDLYSPLSPNAILREQACERYSQNIYLPYIQNVGY